jgi:hypothetical protein
MGFYDMRNRYEGKKESNLDHDESNFLNIAVLNVILHVLSTINGWSDASG